MEQAGTSCYTFLQEIATLERKLRVIFVNYLVTEEFELARAIFQQIADQISRKHALFLLQNVLEHTRTIKG
jgi:hypothetical protein